VVVNIGYIYIANIINRNPGRAIDPRNIGWPTISAKSANAGAGECGNDTGSHADPADSTIIKIRNVDHTCGMVNCHPPVRVHPGGSGRATIPTVSGGRARYGTDYLGIGVYWQTTYQKSKNAIAFKTPEMKYRITPFHTV
jgi:hypothetical protein